VGPRRPEVVPESAQLSDRRLPFRGVRPWLARSGVVTSPVVPGLRLVAFFSSLKTLAMPTEGTNPRAGVNVPELLLAGFQVIMSGRFWVILEVQRAISAMISMVVFSISCSRVM